MKALLITVTMILSAHSLSAKTCEEHFKDFQFDKSIEAKSIMNCKRLTESSNSRNQIYLGYDHVCISEFEIKDLAFTALNFVHNGASNFGMSIMNKKVTENEQKKTITETEIGGLGGMIPKEIRKREITINNDLSASIKMTEGPLLGQRVVLLSATYQCEIEK